MACLFLGVDLKPEGPSLCSHGLTSSLGQPIVSTRVGVCMSVCVCTVCAYMSVCVYVHSGGMYACTPFTLCRCVWVHMSAFVHAWLCACEGMGAVCRWAALRLHPDTSPLRHTLGSENTDCLVFVLFPSLSFGGRWRQRLGPRTCVPSAA